jgi:hypothetical protein
LEKIEKFNCQKIIKGGIRLVVWSDLWGDWWPPKIFVEHLAPRRAADEVKSEEIDDLKSGRTTEDKWNE